MQRRKLLPGLMAGPLSVGWVGAAAAEPGAYCGQSLRFPTAAIAADMRNAFSLDLLSLVLGAEDCSPTLAVEGEFSQPAALHALHEGRLDVAVVASSVVGSPTSAGLLVVREPIRRGLLGLRLLVCKVSRAAEIAATATLPEFIERYSVGYGADWIDLPLYRRCGFRMVTASRYDELFDLLHRGDCDVLTRGVNEVWDEVDSAEHGRGTLMVVPQLAMSCAMDDFFVVRPDAPALRDAIAAGLHNARRSGAYEALFDRHYALALRRSGLQYRRVMPITGYPADPAVARAQAGLLRALRARS